MSVLKKIGLILASILLGSAASVVIVRVFSLAIFSGREPRVEDLQFVPVILVLIVVFAAIFSRLIYSFFKKRSS